MGTTLPIWKTLKLGTRQEAAEFYQAIREARYRISVSACEMMGAPEFIVSKNPIEAELVKVSPRELGIDFEVASYERILARAKHLGLKVCPIEVGPQLLLQSRPRDYEQYDDIHIGMEPVLLNGVHKIFTIEPGSKSYPRGIDTTVGHFNDDDDDCALVISKYVFVK